MAVTRRAAGSDDLPKKMYREREQARTWRAHLIMEKRDLQGMLLGLVGVIVFSLTLPMTHIVVREITPILNGLGRALLAAVPAALLLWLRRVPLPTRAQLKGLVLVSAG